MNALAIKLKSGTCITEKKRTHKELSGLTLQLCVLQETKEKGEDKKIMGYLCEGTLGVWFTRCSKENWREKE